MLAVSARRAYRIAGFVGVTATMLPVYAARNAMAGPGARDALRDRWLRRWSTALLRLFAIRVLIDGAPSQERGRTGAQRGRLVVANHRSTIDIGVLLRAFGGHMVSRADLSGWPVLGVAARTVGTVFVDRDSTVSGASAIRSIRTILSANGTVLLFPEGTTFEGDTVRPFHPGSFVAALRTDAEIVPVGIAYERGSGAAFINESFVNHLARVAGAAGSQVVVRVGKPIPVRPGVRAAELATEAHAAVQALVDEARARCSDRSA